MLEDSDAQEGLQKSMRFRVTWSRFEHFFVFFLLRCVVDEIQGAESITVQCLDGHPMELMSVGASHSRHDKKQIHPFIHFDRHVGAGWSFVFVSSKSRVVVKFAAVPKKDKAKLVDQLNNEAAAYKKLNRIAGWMVPRLYGEYEWHGGRALLLSDEGQALFHLEDFKSLSPIERYGLLRSTGGLC
jgi:hypothetical protein